MSETGCDVAGPGDASGGTRRRPAWIATVGTLQRYAASGEGVMSGRGLATLLSRLTAAAVLHAVNILT